MGLVIDWQAVNEMFTAVVIVIACLVVPYYIGALVWLENHPKVRFVRTHSRAYYRPSLAYLTWLTRVFGAGLSYLLFNTGLRLWAANGAEAAPQALPSWAYLTSMVGSCVFLLLFALPAAFLFHVKHEIVDNEILEHPSFEELHYAQANRQSQSDVHEVLERVTEMQERGIADRPLEEKDRHEGEDHRHPERREDAS